MSYLNNLLKKSIVCGSLISLPFLYNGCAVMENMTEAEVLSAVGTGMATLGGTDKEVAAGLIAKTIGDNQVQKEAAREGKTEITMNINPQDFQNNFVQQDPRFIPEYNLKELEKQCDAGKTFTRTTAWTGAEEICKQHGLDFIFTCNKLVDLDANEIYSFNEFIGKKRNFMRGEEIIFCVGYTGAGKSHNTKEANDNLATILMKVVNEKGEIIYTDNHLQKFSGQELSRKVVTRRILSNLPGGIYTIKCNYSDTFGKEGMFKWDRDKMQTQIGAVFQILE
jgi:hypothetical protein